jgi:hypothetical protein
VITAFRRRFRYRRNLRRAYLEARRAGYGVSDAAYRRMERQARASADGNGD